MSFLLSFLWSIRTSKIILFYLYLWQLKEYHVGRFLDHFRTAKGKKLLFNKIIFLKIFLLFGFVYFLLATHQAGRIGFLQALSIVLLAIYIVEFFSIGVNLFRGNIKYPVLTKKSGLLVGIGFLIEFIFLFFVLSAGQDIFIFAFWFLLFDLLLPVLCSLVVLSIQPFVILMRNQIIKKASQKRLQFPNLTVIGITGSYGKTSTKEFLATILSAKFKVLKTKEHQNSEMGISQCILSDLKPDHQVFVVEMASYARNGIKLLCGITRPKIGIITGVNEQHLALFKTMENLESAEGGIELINSLPEDGAVILNCNNGIVKNLKPKVKSINCSTKEKLDFWAENVKQENNFLVFKAFSKEGESADFKINLLGVHNVENILLAIATAKQMGMSLLEITQACQKIHNTQGAIKPIQGKEGIILLDSTYSANPSGVLADLDYLNTFSRKKVIVMPCLIELGKAGIKIHETIGAKIGQVCDMAIITTRDCLKEIEFGAREGKIKKENIVFEENPQEIATKISVFCASGDAVLLEGRVPKQLIELLHDDSKL